MYLKEIHLHGFKSFADPLRLDLERGVTAIVGPNGCGKSNIADAIRWVLGEQSPKSLRAGAMQDVIFQGTSNRKPVNLCAVSLLFADCEDKLGRDFAEVEVTRRVIRDGGSEYLLNGKSCRLKDIHNLFLDTGVGQVSYSFMLQGQIDQVLSSNPSERRAIFEEAAGISKYKARRKEALNKLAHVDANLARVTDVMEEVARQTNSLKRQASKALRYKRIHHRLSHLDLAQNGFRFLEISREIDQGRQKIDVLENQKASLEEELSSAEKSLSDEREQISQLRQLLEEAQRQVYDLRSEREGIASKIEMSNLRREDMQERLGTIAGELEGLAREEEILAEKLSSESRIKQEQMDLFGSSDEAFKQRSRELAGLQKKLNLVETELSRHKQALQVKEGAVSRLRSNCTTLELDLKTYQVKHANLTEELQSLAIEEEILRKDGDTIEKTHVARNKDRAEQESVLQALIGKRDELVRGFRDLQKSIQELDRERASALAQISVLEDLQAKFEGFSEGARAIMQGNLPEVLPRDSVTVFLEQVKVRDGYTLAVEMLLGNVTDSIHVREASRIPKAAAVLADRKIGRASLLSASLSKTASSIENRNLPDSIIAAGTVVSSGDADLQVFLERFFAGCYIAEDLTSALDLWQSREDFSFTLMATRTGELIDSRGVVLAGSQSGKKDNSSFLSRQNQLKRFSGNLLQTEDSLERKRLESEQIQSRLDAAEKRIEEQRRYISEIGTEVTTLIAQKRGVEGNLESNRKLVAVKQSALSDLEESKVVSTGKLEVARQQLEETEADIDSQKNLISETEEQVNNLRKEMESRRQAFDEVRFEVAQKRQRLELMDRGLDELQRKSRENEASRIKLLEESERLQRMIGDLQEEAKVHARSEEVIRANLDELLKKLDKNRVRLGELERKVAIIEEGIAPKRAHLQNFVAEQNKTEVALARHESRVQFIGEECMRDYDRNPADIDWKLELWKAGEELPERIRVDVEETSPDEMELTMERDDPTDEERSSLDPVDWDSVEEEISSLRNRIQAMGPVNLVAIEEYKDLKERHQFLTEQSDDLWKAKEQLLEAIDEINSTSQEMFADTFGEIRKNFHFTFETLFGGGRADLELIDSEDVLESGIEITAQPPGTRLRNLGLLSGGQKTMTAVALLFAIYMVKPSPFCVLDEIDAPLDDANIGRFTGMLETFLEYSQFLIITHNKRTISVADTIYGVTMPEKGVSRLISMRFNKSTGKAEAAPED